VHTGVTSTDKLAISGRSAGGLLVGAVLNMAPVGLIKVLHHTTVLNMAPVGLIKVHTRSPIDMYTDS
jgi:prolyl oligopeptidase PreP (S9A serine peptidase family)